MRKAAAVLAVVLLLAGCGRAPGLAQLAAGERARVAEVRAGDVVVLDSGLAVKLAGITAPHGEEPYASEARDALSKMAEGQAVELSYGGARRDAYDRALAQVRVAKSGRWLQGALLEAGAARVRTFADNRAMAAPMLEAEARARAARRGLWALAAYRVKLPNEVDDRDRAFQIVEGRVRGAGPSFLDFGGLRAEVAPSAERDFAAAGKAPESLGGRLVRVRGSVGWGGAMRLDHPEQVEMLRER